MSEAIANGDWGTNFETAVCELANAEDVSSVGDEYRHVDAIDPQGNRLAIKIARFRIDDGQRRGRYWISKAEIRACDRFAMGVYREGGEVEDVCRFYPAAIVRRRCPTFVDSGHDDVEEVSRPPWSRFISPGLLEDEGQGGKSA